MQREHPQDLARRPRAGEVDLAGLGLHVRIPAGHLGLAARRSTTLAEPRGSAGDAAPSRRRVASTAATAVRPRPAGPRVKPEVAERTAAALAEQRRGAGRQAECGRPVGMPRPSACAVYGAACRHRSPAGSCSRPASSKAQWRASAACRAATACRLTPARASSCSSDMRASAELALELARSPAAGRRGAGYAGRLYPECDFTFSSLACGLGQACSCLVTVLSLRCEAA